MSDVDEHYFIDEMIIAGENQLFRTLWNTSNDHMFIVKRTLDNAYINEKINPALERFMNVKHGQLDNIDLKDIVNEEMYLKIVSRQKECIEKNIPITYEEKHIIDKKERFWTTTILPIVYEDNIVRTIGISREITSIRYAEIALKNHNEILEQTVQTRTMELEKALADMKELAVRDKLTGLYNRHKIDEVLGSEIDKSKRYNSYFGVVILDIDNFKNVNDKYGHNTGDIIISEFATVLKQYARKSDTVGRWGGEEFLILILESSKESILKFTDRLKEKIENHKFSLVEHNITASFGATVYLDDDTVESLIVRADNALYESKNNGRNIVNFL